MASSSQSTSARVVNSDFGGLILEHAGHRLSFIFFPFTFILFFFSILKRYSRRGTNRASTRIYWRCVERAICNGTASTNFNVHNGIFIMLGKPHLHEPNYAEIRVKELVRGIKRRAEINPNAPPSSILRDEVSSVADDNEVLMLMPQRTDVLRTINRIQGRHRPAIPVNLEDLMVSPPYTTTLLGETFLQLDSGIDTQERILMFYTISGLERLCSSRMILADGTFKTVPGIFYQMYSIHGIVQNHCFPLVYVLTTTKTEIFYRTVLEHLRDHALERNLILNPQYISADFELAFLNAARHVFPGSQLHGCLFHLSQNIWKNAVNKGLKVNFNEMEEVKTVIRSLLALPFVPLTDITEIFDFIVNNLEDQEMDEDVKTKLFDLISYVERVYVRGVPARGRRQAVAPRFPPNLWNCYDMVLTKQQRTTNAVEGWHSRFQRIIIAHHSKIWKFIEHIQKDEMENRVQINQLLAGHTRIRYPVKGKFKKNQEYIERIVTMYDTYKSNGNITNYLMAISYRLKLYAEVAEEEEQNENQNEGETE